jgi:hypothetical protein
MGDGGLEAEPPDESASLIPTSRLSFVTHKLLINFSLVA